MFRYIALLAALATLTACVSTRTRNGYIMERGESELAAEVGVDTKDSVLARYGEPSIIPSLNANSWYYISTTSNARAFYSTETKSRQVVAFNFDRSGKVTEVVEYDLTDGMSLSLVDRETPTRGKELSILEQLIGNVGQLPGTEEGTGPGGGP